MARRDGKGLGCSATVPDHFGVGGKYIPTDLKDRYVPPVWAFDFHGDRCLFMLRGCRMGVMALERLALKRRSFRQGLKIGRT